MAKKIENENPARELLTADDILPKNTKIRITTMLSGDVLEWLRSEANDAGIGYQTLLDTKLRELMESSSSPKLQRRELRDALKNIRKMFDEYEEYDAQEVPSRREKFAAALRSASNRTGAGFLTKHAAPMITSKSKPSSFVSNKSSKRRGSR